MNPTVTRKLFEDLKGIIQNAKSEVATSVNSTLVKLYWEIGTLINREILKKKRASYGKEIIKDLSVKLTAEFGKGFNKANLLHFVKFATIFHEKEILYSLRRELSWTHLRKLIYIEDDLKRTFYLEMCKVERWSTRRLNKKIDYMKELPFLKSQINSLNKN